MKEITLALSEKLFSLIARIKNMVKEMLVNEGKYRRLLRKNHDFKNNLIWSGIVWV